MITFNHILRDLLGWMLFWNAYILVFNKGIPNIRTAPAIRRRIIARLRDEMAACPRDPATPFIIYDLGAGNGLFSRQIARALPDAKIVGIEISKLAFWWAEVFRRLSGLKNLEYRRADMFETDLSDAGAVVFYLHIYFMTEMGRKLHRDLRPGTLVSSNHFRLGDGWVPIEEVDVRTLYPHQKTFYLYRQGGAAFPNNG